ncbi:hypothetical protein ITP53_46360 [Nonomuraea sp. K274]|uniref:Secreted protein n=1 Tax=Nonomuraea cypriaca TaxID=1187855 RepID=A0A931AHI9_9ACTN|nr:hypothetical protein [Nonomuraea cypriaca]
MWEEVVAAVDSGDLERVAECVLGLDESARREVAVALPGYIAVAARRAEMRRLERRARWEREGDAAWEEHVRRATRAGRRVDFRERRHWHTPWNPLREPSRDESWIEPMRVAGAGVLGGAAAVVAWLHRRELRDGRGDTAVIGRVLSVRPPEWRADFATRAALKIRASGRGSRGGDGDALALAMLRTSGVTPPEHDPLVVAWASRAPTAAALREDPLLDHLLPRLFEAEGVGRALRDERADPLTPGTWLASLRALESEGRIGRDLLLDGCVRRFLLGGSARDLRFFVRLHELLEPAYDEVAKRARDYLRLLPAAPGPVAEPALRHLRGLGELEPAELSEAIRALSFRAERKLVTGGLAWLDEVARTSDGDLDELAPALGYAFACESADVQGRAVRLAIKYAKRFTPVGAQAVRDTIGTLPQELGETLAAVFGGEAAEEERGDDGFMAVPLPPPVRAVAFPPPVRTPAELGDIPYREGWTATEVWLAGIVRLSALDRPGLVKRLARLVRLSALDPASTGTQAGIVRPPGESREGPRLDVGWWCERIARLILGEEDGIPGLPAPASVSAPHLFLLRRWAEVAHGARDGTLPPYLLAEPTEGTGHLEAAEFVARLEGYEAAGVQAMPADLQQALLRLPREIPPEVVARAARFTSDAGREAARWMYSRPEPVTKAGWSSGGRLNPLMTGQGRPGGMEEYHDDLEPARGTTPDLLPAIRVEPTGLPLVDDLFAEPAWHRWEEHGRYLTWWPYLMPSDREVVAQHLLPHLLYSWNRPAEVRAAQARALALAGGPVGEGVALIQAYFVADRAWGKPEARAGLVLDMAARGDLAAEELGRQLALLLRRTWFKPGPVLETLESAAVGGAHREVWRVMTGFLPAFLPGAGHRAHARHAQALAFALRAARWAGARGAVPCVAEIAARKASNNFVREARRLHTHLT